MQGIDYFSLLQTSVANLILQFSDGFQQFGQRVFYLAVVLRLVLMGYELIGGKYASGHWEWDFGVLLVRIAIGYTVIMFFSAPIPWLGVSFSHVIIDQLAAFARMLDAETVTRAVTTIDALNAKFIPPGWSEWGLSTLLYWTIWMGLMAARVFSLFPVAWSLIAQAVLVLLGPLFVSLFLLPRLSHKFWSWLDALIEYSFLQVTALAYMSIGTGVLIGLLLLAPEQLTSDLYLTWGVIILLFDLVYILGFFQLHALNASMFRGVASDIAMPRLRR